MTGHFTTRKVIIKRAHATPATATPATTTRIIPRDFAFSFQTLFPKTLRQMTDRQIDR